MGKCTQSIQQVSETTSLRKDRKITSNNSLSFREFLRHARIISEILSLAENRAQTAIESYLRRQAEGKLISNFFGDELQILTDVRNATFHFIVVEQRIWHVNQIGM